ncbi:CCA tRNA nucleotidyltransferase [candidate division TA06 bacterium]|nr:CCA tRNA nucleotidyltransferase [candidate division TA06 bacterium]
MKPLEEKLPQEVRRLLKRIGHFTETEETPSYLVGGIVRDLLLGVSNKDLDIVVEGDGIAFAKDLGQKLKREVKTHRQFGTATLFLKDGLKLDIVTARREEYLAPAVLPGVSPGTLRDDLFRRDFTINSLALRIHSEGFEEIVDLFGGEADLQKGLIRILHPKSFIEDPTRIFRAVRLETRYGFQIEPFTLSRLKEALEEKMIERLTPKRRRTELILLFKESDPSKPFHRLNALGVLKHLHPRLSFSKSATRGFDRVHEVLDQWGNSLKPNPFFLRYLCLIQKLSFEDRYALSGSLAMTKKEMRQLMDLRIVQGRIGNLNQLKPSEVYAHLHGLSSEILLFLTITAKEEGSKKRIEKYLMDSRKVRLKITGRDLKTLGIPEGPLYKKILNEVLKSRLDGLLNTKGEELDFAKKNWEKRR